MTAFLPRSRGSRISFGDAKMLKANRSDREAWSWHRLSRGEPCYGFSRSEPAFLQVGSLRRRASRAGPAARPGRACGASRCRSSDASRDGPQLAHGAAICRPQDSGMRTTGWGEVRPGRSVMSGMLVLKTVPGATSVAIGAVRQRAAYARLCTRPWRLPPQGWPSARCHPSRSRRYALSSGFARLWLQR